MKDRITIDRGTLEEANDIHRRIPEFIPSYIDDHFAERTAGEKRSEIFIAAVDNTPAGYCIAYEADRDRELYIWMVGVLPEFRRHGILSLLMESCEEWARQHSFTRLAIKTKNRFPGMLLYAVEHGYLVERVNPASDILDTEIFMIKSML